MGQAINQQVWHILKSDVAIQRDLWRQIINTRALAKYLIEAYDLRTSLDAVISSIRRFQTEATFQEEDKKLQHIFKSAVISTKNNMTCITVALRLPDLLKRVCTIAAPVPFRISSGSEEFKIIIDNPHVHKMKPLFQKNEILSLDSDLSEISVTVAEDAINTKGVLARIAGELSLSDINIHEFIVVPPEFLIYVKQKDIVAAHKSMLALSEETT